MAKPLPKPGSYIPYTEKEENGVCCKCRVCGRQFWAPIKRAVCSLDCLRKENT